MKIRNMFAVATIVAASGASGAFAQAKPTIVLVHGAFAESSSWDAVVTRLQADGYRVIAAANPLRGPKYDSQYLAAVVNSIDGPVVLVGHSYGGVVISNVNARNVKALVFVSAFSPDEGEKAGDLTAKFPGSTLDGALAKPVALPAGGNDLYIQQDKFGAQFAADVPAAAGRLAGVTQRPIADVSFVEPNGAPSWRNVPSWHIYGDADRNIPPATMKWMAERAGSKETVVLKGASHVPMISQPKAVATIIEHAAASAGS